MATSEGRQELARVAPELDQWRAVGRWLALAESGSKDLNAIAAADALRFWVADQLELAPTAGFEISIVRGKPFISSQLARALAHRFGYRVERVETSEASCTARLVELESGEELGEVTFTIEEARRAGLVKPDSAWTSYPARMLWARASGLVIRDFAPEVLLGLRTDDERDEIENGRQPAQPQPQPGVFEEPIAEAEWTEAPPEPAAPAGPQPVTRALQNRLFALLDQAGFDRGDRDGRLAWTSAELGRTIESSNELTVEEAQRLIIRLELIVEQLQRLGPDERAAYRRGLTRRAAPSSPPEDSQPAPNPGEPAETSTEPRRGQSDEIPF